MLEKNGYKPAINGTAIMNAERDSEGYLITNTDTTIAAGSKSIRITKANADNGASDNEFLFSTLLSFTNTPYVGSTNKFDVRWVV